MATPIDFQKFTVYEENVNQDQYFNKLVDENALFHAYPMLQDVELLEPARRHVAAYAKGNIIGEDGTLMRVFEERARVLRTNKKTVRWRLYTEEGDIRASFIRNFAADAETPGIGGTIFEIGLDTEWFGPNDVIIFENLREIPLLVRSHPVPEGSSFRYEVVLLETDASHYFPMEEVGLGNRVIQIGSLIGEATVERGNIHFTSGEAFIEFEVPITRMGWEMKVTDEAHLASKNYVFESTDSRVVETFKQNNMAIGTNSTGENRASFLYNNLEEKFIRACRQQKDLFLAYGRSSGKFVGKNTDLITTRPLTTSPGLFEFLESSYILDHNPEANIIEFLQEYLPPLWHDKVPVDQRVVDVYTGTGGLKNWQRDAKALDVEGVVQTQDLHYGREEGFFPGRNGVALGAKQYRSVYVEPFGEIRVHYLPLLDSTLVNTKKYKGLPVSSYEYLVFDYGYGDVRDSNMYILEREDVEQYGYSIGTWSPLGPTLNNTAARSRFHQGMGNENAFKYIYECATAFVMKDPSQMIYIKPTIS